MSAFKRILVVLIALIFGTVLLLVVSFAMARQADTAVSAGSASESWELDADKIEQIDLTIELGRVNIVPVTGSTIKIDCKYPSRDYLDNRVKVVSDRDKENLSVRIASKRKAYFFGLIKDKACDITISLPESIVPSLSVKIQAGELSVDAVELQKLEIDGDIAEIEVNNPGAASLTAISIHNNIGNISAYLSNLPEKNHADFDAAVNVGNIDLHLETTEERGYELNCIYNIGKLDTSGKSSRGFGKNELIEVRGGKEAVYRMKTDLGALSIYEDSPVESQGDL